MIRLGDNRSQRSSFSRFQKLNGGGVNGEELAGDATCSDLWHPYVAVGPACQLPTCPLGRHDAPGRVDSAILPLALSLSLIVFSVRPALLRRARALASRHLRPSNSTQRSASFPASPSSRWLWLLSFGKPALPSPSRAHLAGAPPWSPVSWPGLCSPPFLLVLVPKASPCHPDACRDPLSLGLRPETPAVSRTPPPCSHSRARGP